MTSPEITEALHDTRAARGAALLDEYHPDWAPLIDTDALNMSRSYACVLGQLARVKSLGGYNEVFFPLAQSQSELEDDRFTEEFGFDSPADWDWDGLSRAWERQINVRLATPTVGTADSAAGSVV